MAAITPDSVVRENAGSLTLHIATFITNDIDDADTWTSNIPGIVGVWCNTIDNPTSTTDTALSLSISNITTGQVTFFAGEVTRAANVYVVSRS